MTFSLAEVQVEVHVDGSVYKLEIAVADNRPANVLLGQDVDLGKHVWKHILSTQSSGRTAMAVSTRSQEATHCDIRLPEESTRNI